MDLKFLIEQRAEKVEEMKKMLEKAKTEKRAMTDDELAAFEDIKAAVVNMDATIQAEEDARQSDIGSDNSKPATDNSDDSGSESRANREIREFAEYIRTGSEKRANLTLGDNGAVIPQTIAQKIIEKVKQICPIYSKAEMYNVNGTLVVPYYGDNSGENITCAYATEFTDLTGKSGKFTSVSLSGYLAGALTKVSKMLANNSDFDITNFVVNHMSIAIAQFLENELINGTGTSACQGVLVGATNITTSSTAAVIKADDLIDTQESVIDQYQQNAVWIMSPKTRAAIRKFKDGQNNYLLNQDFTAAWGYTLLGKPVYTTESMPEIAASAKAVIYGDLSGLTVNMHEKVNIQVLNELYAAQHAIGVVGWVEIDSKVTDQQKLAVLQIKSST